jgi:hypothetical protein
VIGTNEYVYRLATDLEPLNLQPFQSPAWCRWQAAVLLNKMYLTNKDKRVQVWDGRSSTLADLNIEAPKAKCVEQYQNHLILGDVYDEDGIAPDGLAGSGLGDAEDWDFSDESSDAFSQQIMTQGDAIQRVSRLNAYLALFKEFSIHLIQYVGLPNVYTIQQISDAIGMVSPWALERLPQFHVFMGQEDIYRFNGTMPDGFAVRVWKYILELTGAAGLKGVWTFHAVRNKEIIFALPNGKSMVWNYEYDAFSTRDWPFTGAGYVPTSELTIGQHTEQIQEWVTPISSDVAFAEFSPMVGDADGKLWNLDDGNSDTVSATAITGITDFGRPDAYKLMNGLEINATITGSPLEIYIGTKNSPSEDITWRATPILYSGGRMAFFHSQAVYHQLKFVKNDGTFNLRGYTPMVRMTSRW